MKPSAKNAPLHQTISSIETTRLSFGAGALFFVLVVFVRILLENLAYDNRAIYSFGVYFGHFMSFYLLMTLVIAVLVTALTGEAVERVMRFVVLCLPVIWLPPLLDALVFHTHENLYYARAVAENPLLDFFNAYYNPFFRHAYASPGQRIEMIAIGLALAVYVWVKRHSVGRALAGLFGFQVIGYAILHFYLGFVAVVHWVARTFDFKEPSLPVRDLMRIPRSTGEVALNGNFMLGTDARFTLVLLLISLLPATWLGWRHAPRAARAFLRNCRPERVIHYFLLASLGIVIARQVGNPLLVEPFGFAIDWLAPVGLYVALFFAFESAVLLNDWVDERCDAVSNPERPIPTGVATRAQVMTMTLVTGLLSLALALCVGYGTFVVLLGCHVLSLLYSLPPWRFKRWYPLNLMMIATIGLLVVYYGFTFWFGTRGVRLFPAHLFWGYWVFFVLTLGIKDIKDVEGDRRDGVHTLLTLLGEKRGRLATAGLLCVAAFWLPLWFGQPWFILPSLAMSLLAGAGCVFARNAERWVFPVYYIYFLSTIYLFVL